jgi:IS5 family transposase
VLDVAKRAGVTHGRRFRIDTTVVETNVHYPTDSSLLQDGVRADATMQRASAALGDRAVGVRNRLRSVGRRVLDDRSPSAVAETRDALVRSYRQLMATTRAVVRDAKTMVRRIGQRLRTAPRAVATTSDPGPRAPAADGAAGRARAASDARAADRGRCPRAGQSAQLFEPHTEAIRKGKIAKPTEFGKLVTIQESEHQIIAAYDVHERRPARHDAVDPRAGSPHHPLQPRPRYRCGRSGIRVRTQRGGGDHTGRAPGHLAAARTNHAGATRL